MAGTGCRVEPANLVCKQGIFVQKKYQYPDKTQVHWIEEEKMEVSIMIDMLSELFFYN